MKRTLFACLILALCAGSVFAQKAKPWTEWSKKDAEKMLNDSAWARTQEDTDITQLFYSPGSNETITKTTAGRSDDRGVGTGTNESGAKNQALSLKYRIRFMSAKPVRQAFARAIVLTQAKDEQAAKMLGAKLQGAFVDLDYGDYIVVAVAFEATDRRLSGPVEQALRSSTADTLKNTCYLERKDGKRMFLVEYQQPTPDQTGAKFIFQRTLDGQPFLTAENEIVRFVAVVGEKVKLNMKYKTADMIYDGKLEY